MVLREEVMHNETKEEENRPRMWDEVKARVIV